MRKPFLLLAITATGILAQDILGPYSSAANHADDIQGTPDSRQNTWGTAAANTHVFAFHAPPGYVTRVLRVYGNFQGWIRTPGVAGKCAGVMWGLRSNADDTTPMDYGSANTMLYIQDATCGSPFRDMVDFKVEGGILPDGVLRSIVAVFLNETGQPVHLEPSFTVVFQFEKIDR